MDLTHRQDDQAAAPYISEAIYETMHNNASPRDLGKSTVRIENTDIISLSQLA